MGLKINCGHLNSFKIVWTHLSHEPTKVDTLLTCNANSLFLGSQTQCVIILIHFDE